MSPQLIEHGTTGAGQWLQKGQRDTESCFSAELSPFGWLELKWELATARGDGPENVMHQSQASRPVLHLSAGDGQIATQAGFIGTHFIVSSCQTTGGGALWDRSFAPPIQADSHRTPAPVSAPEMPATAMPVIARQAPATPATAVQVQTEASEFLPTQDAVHLLRRLSGLTWDQLGKLFNVSRRSVHFWASGTRLTAENEAHLRHLVEVVRYVNSGDPRKTRSQLLEISSTGQSYLERLIGKDYEGVKVALGPGGAPGRPNVTPPSAEARAARLPPPPEFLVDAHQEPVHGDTGPVRVARARRIKTR